MADDHTSEGETDTWYRYAVIVSGSLGLYIGSEFGAFVTNRWVSIIPTVGFFVSVFRLPLILLAYFYREFQNVEGLFEAASMVVILVGFVPVYDVVISSSESVRQSSRLETFHRSLSGTPQNAL